MAFFIETFLKKSYILALWQIRIHKEKRKYFIYIYVHFSHVSLYLNFNEILEAIMV